MVWVAGADGCRGGWFRVSREIRTGDMRFDLAPRARDLLDTDPRPAVLALDIPIGLPPAAARDCDRLARACLGNARRSSVFPAPVRPALRAASREEASAITQAIDGRRVGVQSWGLYPKIREVDALLQADAGARRRIHEVHPEVSFGAWAGGQAMAAGKKTPEGRRQRLRLAQGWLGSDILDRARGTLARRDVADDDILDAIATLWTAHRIEAGTQVTLPADPLRDGTGLPMRIVY